MLIDDDDIPPRPRYRAVLRDRCWYVEPSFPQLEQQLYWFRLDPLLWHLVAVNMDVNLQELPKALGWDHVEVQDWVIDRLGAPEAYQRFYEERERAYAD